MSVRCFIVGIIIGHGELAQGRLVGVNCNCGAKAVTVCSCGCGPGFKSRHQYDIFLFTMSTAALGPIEPPLL